MKNFVLVVFAADDTTHAYNLGRWNWNANEAQCGDDVKRAAFARLMFVWSEYYWSYEGDGWIVGDPKPATQTGQIRAFLGMGLTDIVL